MASDSSGPPSRTVTTLAGKRGQKALRGPWLITAGGRDHTVTASISRATYKRYRGSPSITDLIEFPDRGHMLALDSRWSDVADAVLN